MDRIKTTISVILLLLSQSVISAESALDYFPLKPGDQWHYEDCVFWDSSTQQCDYAREITRTVLDNPATVNGIKAWKIYESSGNSGYIAAYYTNNANGLKEHRHGQFPIRLLNPQFSVGDSITSSGVIRAPIVFQTVWDGGVVSTFYGVCDYNKTVASKVVSATSSDVPAGLFDTFQLNIVERVDDTLSNCEYDPSYSYLGTYINGNGKAYQYTIATKLWLSEGIGVVKENDWELVTTNLDDDGDTIADKFDNCPSDSNKDQRDYNNNGEGDACDPSPAWKVIIPYILYQE